MAITAETLRLVEEMRATIGRLLDGVTRRLTQAWVRAWDHLAPEYLLALNEILAGTDRWPTRAQLRRAVRLQQALETTARVLGQLAGRARDEAAAAARAAAEAGGNGQVAIIASQLPHRVYQAQLLVRRARFSERDLAAIVTRTTQRITSLTRPLSAEATAVMRGELVRGVALGDNPAEAARRMVARTERGFNGGLSRALNVSRTEVLDAHRAAAAAGQLANSDVLAGWVWHSALRPTTCAACWSKHGTVHPLEEPGPLDHQQGRCSRTPKTKTWADLGFAGVDEPADLIGDAEETFSRLPRSDQLAIMGPARLAAYQRGEIGWADLADRRTNPQWRPSYTPTPVKDLARN
jgi:hypothetical protein